MNQYDYRGREEPYSTRQLWECRLGVMSCNKDSAHISCTKMGSYISRQYDNRSTAMPQAATGPQCSLVQDGMRMELGAERKCGLAPDMTMLANFDICERLRRDAVRDFPVSVPRAFW
jgi:hypothetical protein